MFGWVFGKKQAGDQISGKDQFLKNVFPAELEEINKRRSAYKQDEIKFDENTKPSSGLGLVGLALSGGGIRSATFNLGLLQAIGKFDLLKCVDYLSTVSGGGYIGSCLTALLVNENASTSQEKFPFRFNKGENPDERKEIKYLRRSSNYLAPDRSLFSLDVWRMIGMYLSGLVLTNVIPVTFFILFSFVLYLMDKKMDHPGYWAGKMLGLSIEFLIVMVVARWLATLRNLGLTARRVRGYIQGALTLIAVALAASGMVVLFVNYFIKLKPVEIPKMVISGLFVAFDSKLLPGLVKFISFVEVYIENATDRLTVASFLGLLAGWARVKGPRLKKVLDIIFRVAWIVLLPFFFIQLVRWLLQMGAFDVEWPVMSPPLWLAAGLFAFSFFINTNRITLHHFYRDRLSEAYIFQRKARRGGDSLLLKQKLPAGEETIVSNESLELKNLHNNKNGPYHLINSTLNVPSSEVRHLRGRGADFFLFSKLYCGSECTGYCATGDYDGGQTRLATAMAISGAAASPRMGTSTNPALTFLMTLLNVRLNRWMPNPRHLGRFAFWPYYFVRELLSLGDETDWYLNLSDGGHHENLGVYELLKRRCELIIASDVGADPNFLMEDLANLMRKARIDLGVHIEMNMSALRQNKETKNTADNFVIGDIQYPDGQSGKMVYIKSSVVGTEPEDLLTYRGTYPAFPDETTADQFFDEAQFESYRELGYQAGKKALGGAGDCFENLLK